MMILSERISLKTFCEYTSACLPGKDACGFLFQNWDNKRGTALSKSAEELPVLRRVPDVQDFNGVVFHAVGDDVRQPPVQQFAGAFLTSHASTLGKLFKRADGFTDFNDGGLR